MAPVSARTCQNGAQIHPHLSSIRSKWLGFFLCHLATPLNERHEQWFTCRFAVIVRHRVGKDNADALPAAAVNMQWDRHFVTTRRTFLLPERVF